MLSFRAVNKRDLVLEITGHLASELADLERESPASPRISELVGLLTMYRFLPLPDYGEADVACPAALVEVLAIESGKRSQVFIVPKGGGLVFAWEGFPVQVVTPESPLGGSLLGRKEGDRVEVPSSSGPRNYLVAKIR